MSDEGAAAEPGSAGGARGEGRGPALLADRRCIAVRVDQAVYGLQLRDVLEVVAMRPVTRVFHAPRGVMGVTSLRGDVLPVLDLGAHLGRTAPLDVRDERVRIVVVGERGAGKARAGLCVDELVGQRDLPEAALQPPPETLSPGRRELISGVIAESPPCALVDVKLLLARATGGGADVPTES